MNNIDSSSSIFILIVAIIALAVVGYRVYSLYLFRLDERKRQEEIERLDHELEKNKLINKKLEEFIGDFKKK